MLLAGSLEAGFGLEEDGVSESVEFKSEIDLESSLFMISEVGKSSPSEDPVDVTLVQLMVFTINWSGLCVFVQVKHCPRSTSDGIVRGTLVIGASSSPMQHERRLRFACSSLKSC